MNKLLFIVNANGGFYYDLFYLLAFLVGYVLLIWIGVKRHYNLAVWLLVLAATRVLFILGTKLFSFSGQEWQVLLNQYYLPPATGKTLLGGLLLVSLGYFAIKKLLRLKTETLDAFALVIPLSIAMQRPGCLLAGCCYGNITGVPWGVQYLPGTLPHYHQFQAGLIQAPELYSLPVHPTQLYEALNGLLVVGILLLVRRYIKAPGNYLTLSFILYCFFRFFSEFMRSPLAHATGGTVVGGLIKIQWCLLAVILGLSVLFIYREKYTKPAPAADQPPAMAVMLLLLAGLVGITWGLRHWLTFIELLAINMALVPAVVFVSTYFFRHIFLPPFRWLALGILVLPLLLMSQTLPTDQDGAKPDKNKISSFSSFKVGFANGKYQNDHSVILSRGTDPNSSCDDQSITKYYEQKYTLQGAGYAYTKKREDTEITYGLNAFAGKHQETDVTDNTTIRQPVKTYLFGVNPYFNYNAKWVGLGGGLVAGNLLISRENQDKEDNSPPTSANFKTPFYPQASIRVGPIRYLFMDYQLAQQFPSALPGLRHQVGVGSGFGLRNGSFLRAGLTGMEDIFVSGQIIVQNRIVLEPLYLWGTSQTPYQVRQRQFSLGLHYRFNYQEAK
ncbi:hypothetical protein AAE02nite_46840 [Adhaeribacter aerolatus]|uniref:Prolipoprotein diacylglyceryl transferase n=1 Tax=Adhaeribacter aerolatus TaxID=670289 RepID=A0A512B4Z7_9BACT|nr:prolipoprotein diacylglyceryl transferase family protein [Adhaeribacter aerolatus]GEO07020.1 hypothetical protein AAE02nite_46840 [Adhaeribacter aerolatus]